MTHIRVVNRARQCSRPGMGAQRVAEPGGGRSAAGGGRVCLGDGSGVWVLSAVSPQAPCARCAGTSTTPPRHQERASCGNGRTTTARGRPTTWTSASPSRTPTRSSTPGWTSPPWASAQPQSSCQTVQHLDGKEESCTASPPKRGLSASLKPLAVGAA